MLKMFLLVSQKKFWRE